MGLHSTQALSVWHWTAAVCHVVSTRVGPGPRPAPCPPDARCHDIQVKFPIPSRASRPSSGPAVGREWASSRYRKLDLNIVAARMRRARSGPEAWSYSGSMRQTTGAAQCLTISACVECSPKGVGGQCRAFGHAPSHLGAGRGPAGAGAWGRLSAAQATCQAVERRRRASCKRFMCNSLLGPAGYTVVGLCGQHCRERCEGYLKQVCCQVEQPTE